MSDEEKQGAAPGKQPTVRARSANAHLRKLTDALKENLGKCAKNPDVDAVHDTRTGTRRIEATIEAELRGAGAEEGDSELTKAARDWERLLKKARRAAAPVRDLDVQRKLLKNLAEELTKNSGNSQNPVTEGETAPAEAQNPLTVQVHKLDDALRNERAQRAGPLTKSAAKWADKLDAHFNEFTRAKRPAGRHARPNAARTALDAFARLADQMLQLDAGNLHDFRKGAKKARYMAEAGSDERAGAVGKALKRLQDEIGDWHDWLMLSDEAHRYLDAIGAKLTAEIERKRNLHFEMALEMERKMRGRLIGEWLAVPPPRPRLSRASRASQTPIPAAPEGDKDSDGTGT